MAYHGSVTRASLENAIKPEQLRTIAVVHGALMAGPLFFALMILGILVEQQALQEPGRESEFLWILTILHLAFTVVSFLAGQLFMQWRIAQWRSSDDANSDSADSLAQKCLTQYRMATIMRLAPLEGAALFGLCICMIAVIQGALPAEPRYWINLASTALLFVYGILTLPSKSRIGDWFEKVYGM